MASTPAVTFSADHPVEIRNVNFPAFLCPSNSGEVPIDTGGDDAFVGRNNYYIMYGDVVTIPQSL
ncbi:MAG: hypothetical protein LBF88_01980 [Planctomycetaceae bacterium]|nr:hypothetical protein [Planctomycetaceae bacterium]